MTGCHLDPSLDRAQISPLSHSLFS